MTRINVVPVEELVGKHLVAEYREIVRVFDLVRKAQKKDKFPEIPEKYRLGRGHVTFFYDKLEYIVGRYKALTKEMRRRGYKPNPVPVSQLRKGIGKRFFNNYEPTRSALRRNRKRIQNRLEKIG